MITEIKPKSPTILNLLKTIASKDFIQGEYSFAKNYDGLSYYDALLVAVGDDTLRNHLSSKTPIPKYKYNKILGDTEGGKLFLESFQSLIDFDG